MYSKLARPLQTVMTSYSPTWSRARQRRSRGDQSVALAVLLDSDRDKLLEVTGIGIYGFGADAVALASDAWIPAKQAEMLRDYVPAGGGSVSLSDELRAMPDEELAQKFLHPVTGRPMEHGDLNKLADEGGLERGLIAEALMIQATNRAGYQRGAVVPFRFAGNNLVWDEERQLHDEGMGTEGDVMRGYLSENLVAQMNAPTLQQIQVQKGIDLSLRERDVLTQGMIHVRKLPARVVLLPEGADHLRVLRQNGLLSGWTR